MEQPNNLFQKVKLQIDRVEYTLFDYMLHCFISSFHSHVIAETIFQKSQKSSILGFMTNLRKYLKKCGMTVTRHRFTQDFTRLKYE